MSEINDFYKEDLLFKGDFGVAPNGDFSLSKGIENVKQRLFHRLITVKGTIVHRPDFGVGIKLFQNGLSSISEQRKIALLIKSEFEKDEAVKELKGVQFKNLENGIFQVTYRVILITGEELSNTVNPFGDIII